MALHDGEFVAAEPRHRVGAGHHALQPLGHRAKQRVADRMAERIVDALEAVEIEEHDRELVAALQRLFHLVLEQHAVRQIGQRIVPRHVNDLGLGLPALGDIFIGRDPAAVRGRRIEARDHSAVAELIKMRANRLVPKRTRHALRHQFVGRFAGMVVDRRR